MRKNINQKPGTILLMVLVGFPQISETIFTPSLPQIAMFYGVSISTAQLTLSIYFLAFSVGVFVWGWLSDRLGRRMAMNLGIVIYGLGSLGCYLSGTMSLLLVSRLVQAFGASTGSITTQTILRESFIGEERHRLFSQISAALAFTPAVGPLIGGFVGEHLGFRAVFFVLVMMSVFIFCFSYLRLPETFKEESRQSVALKSLLVRLLTNKRVLSFGLIIGIINGLLFSYYGEAPYVFIERFHLSQSMYGFLGISVALATVMGALLSNYLLSYLSPEKIIQWGLRLALLGASLLLMGTLLGNDHTVFSLYVYVFSVFILLIGTGISLPNCLSLALVDFTDVIGTAGALFSMGYYLVVSLLTFMMSVLHNGKLVTMPLYFIVLLTVALHVSKYVIKPQIAQEK